MFCTRVFAHIFKMDFVISRVGNNSFAAKYDLQETRYLRDGRGSCEFDGFERVKIVLWRLFLRTAFNRRKR